MGQGVVIVVGVLIWAKDGGGSLLYNTIGKGYHHNHNNSVGKGKVGGIGGFPNQTHTLDQYVSTTTTTSKWVVSVVN